MHFFSDNVDLSYDQYDLPGAFIETIKRKSPRDDLRDAKVERKRQCDNHIINSYSLTKVGPDRKIFSSHS